MTSPEDLLSFWIGDAASSPEIAGSKSKLWFMSSVAADDDLRSKFGELLARAEQGELENWAIALSSSLALVILLDQFSRNIYRGTSRAFANDAAALSISKNIVASNKHKALKPIEQVFLYLPYEHSESVDDQAESVLLFQSLLQDAESEWHPQLEGFMSHAIEHKNIIDEFGRFPHRNKVMGRKNSDAEERYLQHAKTFGQ